MKKNPLPVRLQVMISVIAATALLQSQATWTMAVGGDIMLNGVSPAKNPFAAVAPAFKGADVAYANLEIPLTNARTATIKKTAAEVKARSQYILKADPRHGKWLGSFGLDVVSLANNHAMDYGKAGLDETIRILREQRIAHCGSGANAAEAAAPVVVRAGGMRIGFVSYLSFLGVGSIGKCWPATEKSPGIAGLTLGGSTNEAAHRRIKNIVELAKKKCDMLVVCLHWGVEKAPVPRQYQVSLGRMFLQHGADLILGAHPHVLQGAEITGGKAIFYSTGNFTHPKVGETAAFTLKFKGKSLQSVQILPLQYKSGILSLRTGKEAQATKSKFDDLSKRLVGAFPNKNYKAILPTLAR